MSKEPKGRRMENFSDADVIAHGREARRKRRPIWTNPFLKERAALWRKGWNQPHEPAEKNRSRNAARDDTTTAEN